MRVHKIFGVWGSVAVVVAVLGAFAFAAWYAYKHRGEDK